ncbi:hypothetical protein FSARC_4394 [Fusarium sarcochroum]|uniref:Uncharacterized protein n=1 Tax=Fusarium sarcochroum TaxID=1208366 RepID=A0A8H4U1Y6_9HYPO|nr:hypothetical protein FSARC_4394 [Fusarium sarcochroum]
MAAPSVALGGSDVASNVPLAKIPLRERRALERAGEAQPWEQSPWQVPKGSKQPELPNPAALRRQLVLSGSAKMFGCVAIDMPLKSQELFQYFYQAGMTFGVAPEDHNKDCLAYIVSDPEALRSAVLMAGTHFAFNVGSLQAFEPTFLFHKIETMRMIKEWISGGDPNLVAAIIKQVSTLAYTELCRGDLLLAETHLSVIFAVSSCAKNKATGKHKPKTLDQELSDRYFLLTSTFIYGLKAILASILRSQGLHESVIDLPASDSLRIVHTWHTTKTEGRYSHYLKLKALRMFPAFFNPPRSGAELVDVDVTLIINSLRRVTESCYGRPSKPCQHPKALQDEFWNQGPASVLYEHLIMAHLHSISYPHDEQDGPECTQESGTKASWCGLVISAQIYLEQVVRYWCPFKKEIFLYTMRIFQRDLSLALEKPEAAKLADLLFWEAFVVLLGIDWHEKRGDMDRDTEFKPFLEGVVREQSRALRLNTWADAREVLSSTTWPAAQAGDTLGKAIWEKAVEEESPSE